MKSKLNRSKTLTSPFGGGPRGRTYGSLRVLVVLVVLLTIVFVSCAPLKNNTTISKPIKTFAVVTNIYYGKYESKCIYYANGKKHVAVINRYRDYNVVGSAFEMIYDSLTYSHKVFTCRQVFTPDCVLKTTKGVIYDMAGGSVLFKFHEEIWGEIKKFQLVCSDTMLKYVDILKPGNVFEVKYDVNNQENAIMYFNKPISVNGIIHNK